MYGTGACLLNVHRRFFLNFLMLDSDFEVIFTDEASKQVSERLVIPKEKTP